MGSSGTGTEDISYTNYPLIRYMGSKYKLLPWIKETLEKYDFDSALDGFSGSGAVSYLLKTMGKTVYSNDFLHLSYTLTRACTENNKHRLSEATIEQLIMPDKDAPDFILRTFKDIFFSEEELIFLDNVSHNIGKINNSYKQCLAKSALIRSCLKKQPRGVFTISGNMDKYNDGRRDLQLSLEEHFLEQIQIYNDIIFDNGKKHRSFNMDIYDFRQSHYKPDLVYLDPPYVPRSDDNCYIKRYHFVEGLSKYWENEEINYDTKVHKIKKKYTPFSYRRTAVEAFHKLFDKFQDSIIALSYSSNGFPDLDELTSLMKTYKSEVHVYTKPHKYHFGNHKTVQRSNVDEYLIIGI